MPASWCTIYLFSCGVTKYTHLPYYKVMPNIRMRSAFVFLCLIALVGALQLALNCGPVSSGTPNSASPVSAHNHSEKKPGHQEANHSHKSGEHDRHACCESVDLQFVSSLGYEHSIPTSSQLQFNSVPNLPAFIYVSHVQPKTLNGTSTSPPFRLLALHIPYTVLLI